MGKKERKICIVETVYGLFLYYLICGVNNEDIIITYSIPKEIRKNFKHIYFKKIPYEECYNTSSKFLKIIKKIKVMFIRFYRITKLRIIIFIKTINRNVLVYGHGHAEYSFPLYEYENSYMIEDGIYNYMDLEEPELNTSFIRINNFLGDYVKNYYGRFGTHENIKKIYLTSNNFPEIIKEKVEIIDIKKLWNSKSEQEKTKILKIFNIKEIFNELKGKKLTLLLTQCFSEDGFISIDEEIHIYNQLINKHENDNIIIKTHPREKKDYHEIFPELNVIDKPFPLEIFKCLDIKIDKVITVSSTAALNFMDECEIEIYGEKTSSEEINGFADALKEQISFKRNNSRDD